MVVYLVVEPVIQGIYSVFFNAKDHFTFSNPILFVAKYLGALLVALFLIYKVWELTPFGKKFLIVAMLLLGVAMLCISANFNSTNEEQIVMQRIIKKDVKTWDEVKYISTEAILENKSKRRKGGKKLDPKLEYRIHFQDGTSLNVWDDTDSLYRLHQFVIKNKIKLQHHPVDQDIQDHIELYIEGDKEKIKEILGTIHPSLMK